MTIVTYAVGSKASTMYAATVNGNPLPLWSRSTDTSFSTAYWTAGQIVQQSFCNYAADEPALIVVSKISGPISVAKVYANDPAGPIIPHTIIAGTCRFTLPPDSCAWVEIDNLRGQPVLINSRPLVATPTGPTVDTWNGTQTRAVAGRTLVFPAGVHTIGQSFEVDPGASVFFHGEAWVVGSLHFVGSAGGARLYGHGVLSGEWGSTVRGVIRTLPFEQWIPYCLVYGENATLQNTSVEGAILVDPPAIPIREGPNIYDRVCLVAPWWGNASGIWPGSKWPERSASVSKCSVFCHDDAFDFGEYLGSHTVSDSIVGSIASASFLVSYWPSPNSNSQHTAYRNTLVCLNFAGEDAGSTVLLWCDGGSPYGGNEPDERHHVVSDVLFDGLDFVGSVINGIPFDLRNRFYPAAFGLSQGQALGQIRNIIFRNVTFEVVPANRSLILGKDRLNTPHDIIFENVFFAGVRLTVANAATYINYNEFPYNIYIDGISLRTSATSTGSWYVTSPLQAPYSFQPLASRLNDGRTYDGPQVWFPSGAVLPSRGPFRNTAAPANWSASDVQLASLMAGSSTFFATPTARVAMRVIDQGSSSMTASLSVRQGLAALAQAGSTMVANLTKTTSLGLSAAMTSSSSFQAGLGSRVSLSCIMQGSSSMAADMTPPGTIELGCVMQAGSTFSCLIGAIPSPSSLQFDPMKQRIYNALLALCNAGPFYEAKVDVKTGQMTVYTTKPVKPTSVDVREVGKQYQPASRYRRAYNVAEIASWVFQVEVRFASGIRVSCEVFENSIADAGIKVPEAKGITASRSLLARLSDSKYDEPPAQNPSLGSVVIFTFEVVPETLRS